MSNDKEIEEVRPTVNNGLTYSDRLNEKKFMHIGKEEDTELESNQNIGFCQMLHMLNKTYNWKKHYGKKPIMVQAAKKSKEKQNDKEKKKIQAKPTRNPHEDIYREKREFNSKYEHKKNSFSRKSETKKMFDKL